MYTDEKQLSKVDLYLTQFSEVKATLTLKGGEQRPVILGGEILFSQPAGLDTLAIEEFRRVSLWIQDSMDLGGQASFAGAVNTVKVVPESDDHVEPIDMLLYYPHLGMQKPIFEESDATYPPIETLSGWLSWNLVNVDHDTSTISMMIDIHLVKLIDPVYLGEATGLEFLEPVTLVYQRLQDGPAESPTHNSLVPCSGTQPPGGSKDQRKIKVRFINLSLQYPLIDSMVGSESLENILQRQINGACELCGLR